MRIAKTWRLRFILIASGLAIGFLAKWVAGHYQESPGKRNPDADQPVRRVIDSAPAHPPPNCPSPLAKSFIR